MPRIARGLSDDSIYHVINRGNGKQTVFHKGKDYETFIKLMQKGKERYCVKIFAYCIMPNHFHIVAMPERGENLSKWMQWVMTSHVRRYHSHYGSTGHVWQGRYKSFIVQENEHLLMVMRYVEGNPIRAGLVRSAVEWQWSSHGEMTGAKNRTLTDEVPIEIPKEWNIYVNGSVKDRELECIRLSVNRQAPYGESGWKSQICEKHGLESSLRRRGRPRIGENKH